MSDYFRAGLSAVALAAGLAGPALAGPTYENASGGTFTFYGQFDPTWMSFDDGVNSYNDLADNTNSNSRVGFYVRQPFGAYKFQFHFETALGLKSSAAVNQTTEPKDMKWDRTRLRHVDFSLAGDFGKVSAGQGSMASDGAAGSDLSGTTLVVSQSLIDAAGAYQLTTSGGALSGIKLEDAFANFDGGRKGRIRYDTPSLNGFVLSAAYGTEILKSNVDDDYYDIAVRYNNKFGDYELASSLAVAWTDRDSADDIRDTVASVSVKHASGLNGTVTYGDRDTTGNYYYAKLGYEARFFSVGTTSMAVDYYSGDDLISSGSESESWGVGVVQKFDNYNVEAYASYRDYSFSDNSGTSYNDANLVLVGARWKF
ncbi:porin [Pseudodonghicola xiamenensis]|uniref:Porin domain-containing protein n=1 Tax=Pseudodonghicola xiamenensis TaxID=337702 RepID=A0A8J3MAI5_9RHOB|nr:porin [Pseudodonghicola xiamenensis]GHG79712.1 hypothetical protein GCM10010961_02030 [Pseudodonghicola xiamenensis]